MRIRLADSERMSQFEQFALNLDAERGATGGVRRARRGSWDDERSLGTGVVEEKGEEVAGKPDEGDEGDEGDEVEEAWDAGTTSDDESIEVVEDDSSEDESKENVYKGAGNTSRPRRAAKNKTFNYKVDAEDIDVEIIAEIEGTQKANGLEDSDDGGARGGGYIESSSDEEGPSEEEKLIIKEAKTGLKNIECILWQRTVARSPSV